MNYIYSDSTLPCLTLDLHSCNPSMMYVDRVLALDDGGALIVTQRQTKDVAIRLDKTGAEVDEILSPTVPITSFIWSGNDVLILLAGGNIWKLSMTSSNVFPVYHVEVGHLIDGAMLDKDHLVLLDNERGEAFSYQISTKRKQVKVDRLNHPTSVTKITTDSGVMVVVCECGGNAVHMYSPEMQKSVWVPVRSISGWGYRDGELMLPYSVVVLPNNNFLVTDSGNSRVTEYSSDCGFVRHILQEEDGIFEPTAMSYKEPSLWIVNRHGERHGEECSRRLRRYKY